jgi:hypothetical protein
MFGSIYYSCAFDEGLNDRTDERHARWDRRIANR